MSENTEAKISRTQDIRAAALSLAVQFCNGPQADLSDVISVAREFEEFLSGAPE